MSKILFVELLGGIGDLLIALPAIQAIRKTYPRSRLHVLTFSPGGKLFATDPDIDRVIYAERGKARQAVERVLTRRDA